MTPVRVHHPPTLERIYMARVQAWREREPEFPVMSRWSDAHDLSAEAMHWAVFDGDTLAAAARLTVHAALADIPNAEVYAGVMSDDLPGPIGALARLFVLQRYAGRGLSRALDLARIEAARYAGCRCVIGATLDGKARVREMQEIGFQVISRANRYTSGPLAALQEIDGGRRRPEVALLCCL